MDRFCDIRGKISYFFLEPVEIKHGANCHLSHIWGKFMRENLGKEIEQSYLRCFSLRCM